MIRKASWFFARTSPLIAAMLLSSCGGSEPITREDQQAAAFADLRSAITETVTDEDRRRDVLAVTDSLENDVDELRALLVRRRRSLALGPSAGR